MTVERERRRSRTTYERRVSSLSVSFPLFAFATSSATPRSCLPRARGGTPRAGSEAAEESRGGQERAALAGHEGRRGRTVARARAVRFSPARAQQICRLFAVEFRRCVERRGCERGLRRVGIGRRRSEKTRWRRLSPSSVVPPFSILATSF